MENLIAYHGDKNIKKAALDQIIAHAKADELTKGKYWEGGKGCAVGCQIHSSNHVEYESRFGIPVALARLEDCVFEGLPNDAAMEWPIRFMSAIRPGQDLSLVSWKFLYWILTDETINPGIAHPLVKEAVAQAAQVICHISKGGAPDKDAAKSAASAASAAWSAAWNAESAAWSAASAESAASAAWNADSAAWNAARSAGSAAWSAAYVRMAEKLIELIKDAP